MRPTQVSPADAFRNLPTGEVVSHQVHEAARDGYTAPATIAVADLFGAVDAAIHYRYDIWDYSSATEDLTDTTLPLTSPPANLTSALVNAWRRRKE
jgi:hypothetical protein